MKKLMKEGGRGERKSTRFTSGRVRGRGRGEGKEEKGRGVMIRKIKQFPGSK